MVQANSIKSSKAFFLLIRQIAVPALLLVIALITTKGAVAGCTIPLAFAVGVVYVGWEQYKYQVRKNLIVTFPEGSH